MKRDEFVLDAAFAALGDLCTEVLDLPFSSTPLARAPLGVGGECVSVALVNDDIALQIGLAADRLVLCELVRPMLGAGPTDVLEPQDVIDAASEAVNIMAGNFKTRINNTFPSLRLGLPLVTVDNPRNEQPKSVTLLRVPVMLGQLSASLIIAFREEKEAK